MSNVNIGVRVTVEMRKLLDRICRNIGEDFSHFARRAIVNEFACLGFLSEEKEQALGVSLRMRGKADG